MDNVLDDIMIQVRRCERAAKTFAVDPLKTVVSRLNDAAESVGQAWSGSWLGYQSRVYYAGFVSPPPGAWFSVEWGLKSNWHQRMGDWQEWSYEDVANEILSRAGSSSLEDVNVAARKAGEVFEECQMHMVAVLDAALAEATDTRLKEIRDKVSGLESHIDKDAIVRSQAPKQIASRDRVAMGQGIQSPPHIGFLAVLMWMRSYGFQLEELAKLGRQAGLYLEKKLKMKGASVAKKEGKIFIGHGRSQAWRDLKDFIQDRLKLAPDEFNLSPAAGLATKERLEQMLDEASFAFLVMTAEDEHADATAHARENVVHEAGLFQGRLGFRRAIILLEEGCAEFSNIQGLGQIRFPKGNIKAKSEEIRAVLEREGLL
jgi:predicted nucleotide-binding protein